MDTPLRHENYKIQPLLKNESSTERTPGMFTYVVTAYNEPMDKIMWCLDSIIKQDYEKIEIIVCFDKPRDEVEFADELVDKYTNHDICFRYHENVGSSENKNIGMRASHGEYIACVGADMIVNAGTTENFVKAFEEDPEIAMVYTGYSFLRDPIMKNGEITGYRKQEPFPSYPTDEHDITVRNAVDATMPQRFEYAVLFDNAFHSLGDWDWAITHIRHYKHKVVYCKDFLAYKHSIPITTGLSSHSHRNWEAILGYLSRKHNFTPHSERTCVFANGAKHHGDRICKLTGWDYNENIIQKPYNYKECLLLGFYHNNWELYVSIIESNPRTKFSVLFVGADIAAFNHMSVNDAKALIAYFKQKNIRVFTESERCQKELAEFRIDSEIMCLPVLKPEVVEVEHPFTVGVYTPLVPREMHPKYAITFCIELAIAMPHINFVFFGGQSNQDMSLPNVTFTGWKPINEVIGMTDVLLRVLPFDGLSVTGVEYLMSGKPVITNNYQPGSYLVNCGKNFVSDPENMTMGDPNDSFMALRNCMNAITHAKNGMLDVGRDFDPNEYSFEKFIERFNKEA